MATTKTCIVIPVTWTGTSGDGASGTLSTTSVQWDATLVKANQFYAENSYSLFQWVFTRIAPITITAPSLTSQGGLVNEIFPNADAAATSAGHDPTTFDVTVYIVSDGTVFGGDLTTGQAIPTKRGKCAVKALTMQTATSPGWEAVSHELGHALGIWGLNFDADRPDHFDLTLPHASTLEMPHNVQFDPTSLTDVNVVEYGNLFDDMGGGIGGHFHAKAKYELGWMAGRTQAITTNGTYTLAALEGAALATQALIVSDGTYRFWIEYRRLVGLESTVSGLQFPAVMIYLVAPLSMNKQGIALLLDMTPSEQPSATDLDPGLPVTTTFTTPSGLSIKNVSMGTTASITVSGVPLTRGLVISGPQASQFSIATDGLSGQPIASGAFKTATIVFSPPAGSVTNASATLTITDSTGTAQTQPVTLSGIPLSSTGVGTVAPSSQNFGTVLVGQTSSNFTFTLTNTGGNPSTLSVASVALTGANPSQFAIVSDTGQASLGFNQARSVVVNFHPSSGGSKSASLSFTDNSGGVAGTVQAASLTGTASTGTGIATVTPASPILYPDTSIGQVSTKTVTVTNTGTGNLTISTISISPSVAG